MYWGRNNYLFMPLSKNLLVHHVPLDILRLPNPDHKASKRAGEKCNSLGCRLKLNFNSQKCARGNENDSYHLSILQTRYGYDFCYCKTSSQKDFFTEPLLLDFSSKDIGTESLETSTSSYLIWKPKPNSTLNIQSLLFQPISQKN